jgi:hypothetical protein
VPDDRAHAVEVLSEATNSAVVRMPGRRFPGAVIQGDSLHALYTDLRDLEHKLTEALGRGHELIEEVSALAALLHERLWWYEQDLKSAGYSELPYEDSVGMPHDRPVA